MRYCGLTVSRRGSAMVPWYRAVATSYRLSIVTMCPSAAIWPQFWMERLKLCQSLSQARLKKEKVWRGAEPKPKPTLEPGGRVLICLIEPARCLLDVCSTFAWCLLDRVNTLYVCSSRVACLSACLFVFLFIWLIPWLIELCLTGRRRDADAVEEKSACVSAVVERIKIALAANDRLVSCFSMSGSYKAFSSPATQWTQRT